MSEQQNAVVVKGYADLASERKLRGDDPDVVARELAKAGGDHVVAWVPDWLIDQSSVSTAGRSRNIVSGRLEAETDKALLVVVGSDETWLPKSQIILYEMAPNADLTVPQHGLSDYATTDGGRR